MENSSNFEFKSRPHLTKEQRLPRSFTDTEKVIKTVKSCKSNFKTVLANSRFRGSHFNKVYSLTINVLKHYDYIQRIIDDLQLLEKETPLRREIASILIHEILFGNGSLPGKSKPIITIQKYKNDIMQMHQTLQYGGYENLKVKAGFDLPRYVRIHTLVTTVPYVVKDLESIGFEQVFYDEDISEEKYIELVQNLYKRTFLVDYHFKDVLVFAYNENLVNLELYQKGHIFLQDKSSYIPIHVLNPEPGSAVLDACAAPGIKSVHIASKMENKGVLIACELNKDRFETLKEMLQHGAVKISKIFCKDFKLIDPNGQGYSSIDYILLDPSCSGSGMVNRMDEVTDTEDSKTKERLEKLAGFQIVLLKHALKFPSVKRVVYSTCSVHEQENEYVVHEALNAFSYSYKLVPVMPEWPIRGLKSYEFGEFCLRTEPEKNLTNGFFVAMFERIDGTELYEDKNSGRKFRKNKADSKKENSVESNNDSQIQNFDNCYELTKRRKKDAHHLDISNSVNGKNENVETHFDSSFSNNVKKKKNRSTSEFSAEITKENKIQENRFDSSLSNMKKKKNRSTSKFSAEVTKENEIAENHFDSSFSNAKKNKNRSTSEFSAEIMKNNETPENHFDSSSTRKRKKKDSDATESTAVDKVGNNCTEYNKEVSDSSQKKAHNIQEHQYSVKNSENIDYSSKEKKERKNKEIKNELENQFNINKEVVNLEPITKSRKSKKHQTNHSCLETVGAVKQDDVLYRKDDKPLNLKEDIECTVIANCDNGIVKSEKKQKYKGHLVNTNTDSVKDGLTKHKKKKHKRHSEDNLFCESQMLANDESIQENVAELELQNFGMLENSSKKHKKKHKKHFKERGNHIDGDDSAFITDKSMPEIFNTDEVDLEAHIMKSKSDCLLLECVNVNPVKMKKHKKHSKDLESKKCIDENKKSCETNLGKEEGNMKDCHNEVNSLSQSEMPFINVFASPRKRKHKKTFENLSK